MPSATGFRGSKESRAPAGDLGAVKLKLYEAICRRAGARSGAGGSASQMWSLYRKGLRLFLLGELAKGELDAIVLYTLGPANGKPTRSGRLGEGRSSIPDD
jgi:hypothetical protein